MPLTNAIQLFDGRRSTVIFSTKREIAAIDMRGDLVCIGEKASPGQLISAVLVNLRDLDKPTIFNYQKTQLHMISISLDGQFFASVGSSSDDVYGFGDIGSSST